MYGYVITVTARYCYCIMHSVNACSLPLKHELLLSLATTTQLLLMTDVGCAAFLQHIQRYYIMS